MALTKNESRLYRKQRIRKRILRTGADRPRLSVFRSGRHIYAQIIDDHEHKTLVACSTISKDLKGSFTKTTTVDAAKKVGEALAKKAIEKKIKDVAFDRNGFLYHGRVKALAEAARKAGLNF
ncbi:MAG: 50S ribosomal protein L18 [Pseudomonadota bacterium]